MDRETIQKEIEHLRDLKNNLLAGLIITASGTLNTVVTMNGFWKPILVFLGSFFSIVFFRSYLSKISRIRNFLNQYKEINE